MNLTRIASITAATKQHCPTLPFTRNGLLRVWGTIENGIWGIKRVGEKPTIVSYTLAEAKTGYRSKPVTLCIYWCPLRDSNTGHTD